ncbi:MAG: mycofactocin system glycosyltransferase [Geobacter sp.]|nr:mycofactocin system glycosyltransferase [Geobacter sp.]
MKYRLARHVELVAKDGGQMLVSRSPLSIVRLNSSLHELLSRTPSGTITPLNKAEESVLEQLLGKGFVEKLRDDLELPEKLPTVSIVIPVKDRAGELARCLESINRLTYPQALLQIIVVDDGSSDASPEVARQHGAEVVPSGGTGRGPAAARNAGAKAATGEILAFIDSDCTASEEWLLELLPAFDDARTVAVGGLVDGMCRESAIDRYEAVMSSLSLGKRERSGSSGDDTFYLPSCNLLVRRLPFATAGGFKDGMHVGEDVDLTWRLRDQGWTITYLPVGRVYHEHRSSARSFMSRRFDYGTSEGTLQRLHARRHKRMVVPPLLAIPLAIILTIPFFGWRSLLAAAIVMTVDICVVRRRVAGRGLRLGMGELLAGRLRAMGSLVYYISYHLIRYYALLLLVVVLCLPWWLPAVALIFLVAATVDYQVRKAPLSFAAFAVIYLLEQLAYGAGVFWGCLLGRTFRSYRVEMLATA